MATNNVINGIGPQPLFSYMSNAAQTGIAGNGSTYSVLFPDIVYDYTSSFDGVSTFTAPIAGIYSFTVTLGFSNLAIQPSGVLLTYFQSTSTTYTICNSTYFGDRTEVCCTLNVRMALHDTAYIQVGGYQNNTSKTINLDGVGLGFRATTFSGYLIKAV